MMRAFKLALPVALLAMALTFAAGPPTPPGNPFAVQEPDQLDLLYNASDRPVLIRLHLRAGDSPYPAPWEAWMDRLFVWFDKDNDGSLSSTEATRIPEATRLFGQVAGSIGGRGNQTVPFVTLDKDKDSKVSREEFRAYYRASSMPPLQFNTNNNPAQLAKQVNDSIYRRLGRSGKAKLTKEDIGRLPGLLAKLDTDEDETLSSTEINTDGDSPSMYGDYAVSPGQGMSRVVEQTLFQIQPTHTGATLTAQVMSYYDTNRDGRLKPGERGLDKTFVTQFDADKDGQLTAKEVEAFFRRDPDVVLRAKVGSMGAVGSVTGLISKSGFFKQVGIAGRAEIVNRATMSETLAKKVKRTDGDTVSMDLGDTRITMNAEEGQTYNRLQGTRNFYLQQFDGAADKDGNLERKDAESNPYFGGLFTQADKNADGKLHRKEFAEYLDLLGAGSTAFVRVQVTDNGRSLYNLLDGNGDSKLTIRELRSAWERVQTVCRDGQTLSQEELPRGLQVKLNQGFDGGVRGIAIFGEQVRPTTTVKGSMPIWFTKMDINGDGDISSKEWLGSEEAFAEIDIDKDGLISAAEAQAYETKKKDASKKK